ncbi:hypothetical protein quinque_016112 [Culex quinquefasciatus]
MDLSTILLLLETPPPKGGHSLLVDHLNNSARSTPVAGRRKLYLQHQHHPNNQNQNHPFHLPPASPQHHAATLQLEKKSQQQLLKSKRYYCSNPMLNNNQYCNLDMESLEDMLKKTTLYISLISSDGEDMVAIASTLLRITPFPTVIITVPKAVRELSHSRSVCVVLLNDPWPYLGFEMWDRTLTRTIVVTNLANMRTVANAFSGRQQIPRVIYLIYDDPETPFRYYQPYNRTFHYLRRIDSNPFDAAEQDLHGMLVSANLSASIDQYLLETVLDRVNATFTTDLDYTHLMVPDLIEEFLEGFNDHINYVDMQRSNYYVLLVPKSKRKPLFSVLYDPFDWFTWISFGGIVVLLGAILVLLTPAESELDRTGFGW